MIGITSAAVVGSAPALAESGVELTWSAPDECPGRRRVVAEIERLLGRPLDAPASKRFDAHAEITPEVSGFSLRVTAEGDGATRERALRADTCEELADAAALIIAMAVDPAAVAARSHADPEPPAAPPPATPRAIATPPAAVVASSTRPGSSSRPGAERSVRGVTGAFVTLETSALPAVAPGFGLSLGLLAEPLRVELSGAYFLSQRADLGETGAGGDIALAIGGAHVCLSLLVRPVDLGPCLGLEAGALLGSGFGVSGARSDLSPWLAPQAGLRVAFAFTSHLGAGLRAGALVPLLRERFLLGDLELYRPPPVTARVELGIEVRWP
jgi:hypothetical protein